MQHVSLPETGFADLSQEPVFSVPRFQPRLRGSRALFAFALLAALFLPVQRHLAAQSPAATPATLTIDASNIVSPVSPTLYGMMTEEINHAFDGGLYAELLQNRTFRPNWTGIERWDLVRNGNASAAIAYDSTSGPSTALPNSVKLTVKSASPGNEAGVANSGFWGIPLRPHTSYKGSFYAMTGDAAIGAVTARLVADKTGATLAEAHVAIHAGSWARYEYTLTTGAITASSTNHLQLTVAHAGTLSMQLASLMPPTYHDTPNGNRPDLMERLAGLHPKFLRLPGGNYLEGDRLEDWYNWKRTIGPLVDRPGHQAPWSYWSTDGLGLLEFLEWCQDLKIEPVLAVYAGYALRGDHIAVGKDLAPFVQSALDEVEYVTGDTSTKWGAERARDGHPAPFPLHYIEVGNEDQFDKSGSYDARFGQFAKALHTAYPQYKVIATTPVKESAADEQPDVIDDHYYKPPAEMMDFVHHYDDAPRTGPKIFVGEWASMSGVPTPNFGSTLSDAAWMTSMERNSDLIIMASYAPLLVNINPGAMQWSPDLIGYDAMTSYLSPSYYAQSLFAGHLGDGTPKSSISGAADRFFYSATVGSSDHVLHLKLVNASTSEQSLTIDLQGSKPQTATITSLHGGSYESTNSIGDPERIAPKTTMDHVPAGVWHHNIPALTIQVIDIPTR
jgi:alpha-N-arabinofuranosidase